MRYPRGGIVALCKDGIIYNSIIYKNYYRNTYAYIYTLTHIYIYAGTCDVLLFSRID